MRDGLTETNLTDDSLTEDRLLGGRVLYRQPREGFRAAIDPVLLAAAIPAWAGEHVLEGGTGAGAALLCLAARVPGITGLGIDRDPALVLVARANAAANSRHGLDFVAGDLAASPLGGGGLGTLRPCLRQSTLSRTGGNALATSGAGGSQTRGLRHAGDMGRGTGEASAVSGHADLHPAAAPAGRVPAGVTRGARAGGMGVSDLVEGGDGSAADADTRAQGGARTAYAGTWPDTAPAFGCVSPRGGGGVTRGGRSSR